MSNAGGSKCVSSFVAGVLIGVAVTAGVAAAVVRLAAVRAPETPAPASTSLSVEGNADLSRIRARELRLAHGLTVDHPVHLGLVRFAELVEAESGGRLTVQIFPNGELGGETVTIEQLQSGTLDFAKASSAPLGSFSPDFEVFSVPFVFRDRDHFWATLEGPVGREILDSLASRGLRGLCYMDAGARSFYTAGDPILAPTDLAGRKVRVMESQTAMDMVSAFGGAPTPMAYAELYSALQSRLVDAAENNPPSFYNSRHYEVARHYTLDEHSRVPDVLLVSDKSWRAFSPEARAVIERAASEASRYQRELWAARTTTALDAVKELGVEVHTVDQAAFAEVVAPLKEAYRGTRVGELIGAIAGVQAASEGEG